MKHIILTLGAVFALAVTECPAAGPVSIFLAGDSTMAEKLPEKRPETGWGEMLQDWFLADEVVISNHAKNGRSTRTFIEEGRWNSLLEQVHPGDYVFIQFGHNDQSESKPKRYTPPEAFKANLARFASDIKAREATPVLLTPVVRRRFDENGAFYDVHGVYPDLVRDVATQTNTTLIDVHASSTIFVQAYGAERSKDLFLWLEPADSANYPEGLEDNTHFSPYGARAMASLVMQDILASLPGLAPHVLKAPGGVQNEIDIAQPIGGPHKGGGKATDHWFFQDFDPTKFIFRKIVLNPGSAIGYHLHDKDEIYYILDGAGELTLNGETSSVGPGAAVFTRPGDSHGLRQVGESDLAIIVVYETRD